VGSVSCVFAKAGIEIHAPDVTISGSRIGLTRTGVSAGNGTAGGPAATGILAAASNARIGGDLLEDANVISGNTGPGIRISGPQTTGVVILRNLIGTSPGGEQAMGNAGGGITLDPGVSGSQIGAPGRGNLISGNPSHGILVDTAPSTVISANRIGTNSSGSAAVSGNGIGVWLRGAVEGTQVGGSTAEAGNLISANTQGLYLESAIGPLLIAANRVGVDATGMTALGNAGYGIHIAASRHITIGTDSDGHEDFAEGNLISGNGAGGILVTDISGDNEPGVDSIVIAANRIGTDVNGSASIRNRDAGIRLSNGATGVLIGTRTTSGNGFTGRNLISGNEYVGVLISGSNTHSNTVAGNWIGTNSSGNARLGNWDAGVAITEGAHHNVIGIENGDGSDSAAANLILGDQRLVWIRGAFDNVVAGNYLGTDAGGTQSFYSTHAVVIDGGSQRNRIGTDGLGGNNHRERNIIASESHGRIVVSGANTSDNRISGNYIGVTPSGNDRYSFCIQGIIIAHGARRTLIGTDGDGNGDVDERNLLAGHGTAVEVYGAETSETVIAGNYFGLSASGTQAFGNITGVNVYGFASDTRIGTDGSNDSFNLHERNVFAGGGSGPGIMLNRTTDVVIAGNYIGMNATARTRVMHTWGITATDHVIGLRIGTNGDGIADDAEGNVVSGNQFGISVSNWAQWDLPQPIS
jgi:titin